VKGICNADERERETDRRTFFKFGRRWMSRREMAKYLNVSLQTLDWLRFSKRVPWVRAGRRVLMNPEAVDAALARLEMKAIGQD
jgi:excisionase family DNA binding protein